MPASSLYCAQCDRSGKLKQAQRRPDYGVDPRRAASAHLLSVRKKNVCATGCRRGKSRRLDNDAVQSLSTSQSVADKPDEVATHRTANAAAIRVESPRQSQL